MKTGSLLLLFLCLCSSNVIAQTRYLDSLDVLIREAKTDTSRISLINIKTERLRDINLDSALALSQENLKAAKALNFKRGEVDILLNLANIQTNKGDYKTAEKLLANADSLAKILKNERQITSVYSGLGILYGTQGKYDSANIYFKKLIAIQEKIGDSSLLGKSYGNLAIGYQMQSDYPQTLFYQQKSLRILEAMKDEVNQSILFMNIGITYQVLQDTLKSEQSFLKGIRLANKYEIKNVALYGYSNLAGLYSTQYKWAESYDYAMLAAKLAKEMGDESIEAASMAKAAKALLNLDRFDEADDLATTAIALAEKAAQPRVLYQVYSTHGKILTREERYREAILPLEKSIKIIKSLDAYDEDIAETYANLSLCYEKTGKYEPALENFKISAKITDSVRANENIRKATELSMNYDFEKKEALAKTEQDKKDVQTARAKNRQLYFIIGLSVLLLCGIVIALILFKNNKQKQKANLLLKRQKLKVEKTIKELKTTQTQLIQSEKMASLGELTAGIAHEIQNPLNFVNNFSEVSEELIDEMNEELDKGDIEEAKAIGRDIKENLSKITHHGKRADAIVKGMLAHSRSGKGEKALTDLNALAEEYLKLSYHGLRAKDKSFNADFKTDLDPNLPKANVVPQDIGRVLLNLINNAFQAVGSEGIEKPTVTVKTQLATSDQLLITVADNGPGIPDSIKDKIFQPFFTTKPTGQGTGLGLSLSYDIVKAHGGELALESTSDGAKFMIKLPKQTEKS